MRILSMRATRKRQCLGSCYACTCTKPHIPLQGRVSVSTSTGNHSEWLSNLASQCSLEFCRRLDARTLSALGGEFAVDAWSVRVPGNTPAWARHIRVERAGQSVKDNETQAALSVETLCQQLAGDTVDQCGVGHQQILLGADHATLDRVLVRHPDEELFANGESAAVTRLALFGTVCCRGVLRHTRIMSRCRRALMGFIRDEPGFSMDPLLLEALVI